MAAIAGPALGFGPIGWTIGGACLLGGGLLAKKQFDDHYLGSIHNNRHYNNYNDPRVQLLYGGFKLSKKRNGFNKIGKKPDYHNGSNPNNRGPNGEEPQNNFYYHTVNCRSKKEAREKALKAGYGNAPYEDKHHFHPIKILNGKIFKFGNAHYCWPYK